MNCDDCREVLHAFLDGELQPAASEAVQTHLDGCEACFRRSQVEEAFRRTLRDRLEEERHLDGLLQRVRTALDAQDATAEPRPAPARPQRLGTVLAAAAALVAGLALGILARDLGAPDEPEAARLANPVQLRGRLACLGCLLAERPRGDATSRALVPPDLASLDDSGLHGQLHLETAGRLWSLAPTVGLADELLVHENAGREVVLIGTALPEWNAVEVTRVHFL